MSLSPRPKYTPALRGRRVLVTGAARGIGAGLADLLTAHGARVALAGLEPELLAEVAQRNHAPWRECDVSDPDQVDRAVEALMARRLAPAGYPLVGEEGHAAGGWAGRVWVLDPIDGTLNYIAVHRHWAISLALVEDGRPVAGVVADPVDDRVYTAVVGAGGTARHRHYRRGCGEH